MLNFDDRSTVKHVLRIFKMIAISGQLQSASYFVFGQGSAPNPTRGAYSAPQTL